MAQPLVHLLLVLLAYLDLPLPHYLQQLALDHCLRVLIEQPVVDLDLVVFDFGKRSNDVLYPLLNQDALHCFLLVQQKEQYFQSFLHVVGSGDQVFIVCILLLFLGNRL